MKAMILAAGRGERLRPLTDTVPKPLLQVGGKPLIVWQIERLRDAGLHNIIVNHAYLGHLIEATLGDGKAWGVNIEYSREKTGLETAGGIRYALSLLGNDPFIVVNADVWTDFPFAQLVALSHSIDQGHLVLVANPPHHPTGDFGLNGEQLDLNKQPRFTFSGIGMYRPTLFAGLPLEQGIKLIDVLRPAIQARQMSGEIYSGQWLDVGTLERLQEADRLAKK